MRFPLLWLALASVICCSQGRESSSDCLKYEPAVVQLAGELVQVERFGPPGYGEHPAEDQRVRVPILRLDTPIDVYGDMTSELNWEGFERIRKLQLIMDDHNPDRWLRSHVRVHGTLSQAMTGHHYTDVVLTVSEIRSR